MRFLKKHDGSNPYAPVTKEEKTAARKYVRSAWWKDESVTSRDAFSEGMRQNPANQDVDFSTINFEGFWMDFVEADLKLPRGYPEGPDVFMAGYRTAVKVDT
jgi:hypothetical protein